MKNKVFNWIKQANIDGIMIIIFLCSFLQGVNQNYIAILVNIFMLGLILYKINNNKAFYFSKDWKFIITVLWALSYLLVCIYAVDRGISFLGFLKWSSVIIFVILTMQYNYTSEQKDKWYNSIAASGVLMVIISLISINTGFKNVFFYNGRLGGFFSYANTFSLWITIGIIAISMKKQTKFVDYIMINILLVGLLLANSRAMMIIAVVFYLITTIINKNQRKELVINMGVMAILAILINSAAPHIGALTNRVSNGLGGSSEWISRLLYYKDAISMIKQNPFGYGHMGWWFILQEKQTGVYDAMYVHNSLLQIALDVGIIPMIMILVLFTVTLVDKRITILQRLVLLIVLGHSLIDFDMEFLIVVFSIFIIPVYNKVYKVEPDFKIATVQKYIITSIVIFSYFFIVTFAESIGKNHLANKMYPYFTTSIVKEFASEKDEETRYELAKSVWRQNKYLIDPYYVIADWYNKHDEYEKAYQYEKRASEITKYTMAGYIRYVAFLNNAMNYYYKNYDMKTTHLYIDRILEVPNQINRVLKETNPLTYKTIHKPRLDIPAEMSIFFDQTKEFKKQLAEYEARLNK